MKRSILVLALTLGSLSLALPDTYKGGGSKADVQNNQNSSRQAESSTQGQEEEAPVFDMNGKRMRVGETYIAQRTLQDGRVIAYRKNKREIAALVKALKEDGFTDKELLDQKKWMATICHLSKPKACVGGCSITQSCRYSPVENSSERRSQRVKSNLTYIVGRCVCSP